VGRMCKQTIGIIGLFSLYLLSGCGQVQGEKVAAALGKPRWDSFPVDIYVDQRIMDQPTAISDLSAAFQFWEDKANRQLFRFQGAYRGPASISGASKEDLQRAPVNGVFFENPWSYGPNVPARQANLTYGSSIRRSIISVDPGSPMCAIQCGRSMRVSFRRVMVHELGHLIGLDHHPSPNNIMFAVYQDSVDLSTVQIDWAELSSILR
jgi:hypothetical protein